MQIYLHLALVLNTPAACLGNLEEETGVNQYQNVSGAMSLVAGAPLGIILVNSAGAIEYANKSARFFALQSKVRGQTLLSSFPFLVKFDQRPETCATVEKDGQLYYLRISKETATKQGDVLISLTDETAQKKLQQENHDLRQTVMLYETMLNSIDEGILAVDKDGCILFMNRMQEKLDNLKFDDIKGMHLAKKYHLRDNTSILLKILKTGNRMPHQPQYYLTEGGNAVNVVTSSAPLFNKNDIIGAVSISQDFIVTMNIFDQMGNIREKQKADHSGVLNNRRVTNNGTHYCFENIIGESEEFREALECARRAAASVSNVLLYGETGTGKELFAQSIHNASPRKKGAFVAINCAALPESLLESILFGTSKGAFTGAIDRPGLFEQASHGTLFLDEINSMPLFLQSKLLRVLQEGRLRRIGSTTETDVSPRIISSLNIEPQEAMAGKQLRQDLYYRLAVVSISIPSLRERRDDISLLTSFFLQKYNQKLDKNVKQLSDEVLQFFEGYGWPGNVRELQHVVEGAMNIMPEDQNCITIRYLPKKFAVQKNSQIGTPKPEALIAVPVSSNRAGESDEPPRNPLARSLKEAEKNEIAIVLTSTDGNISKSARLLGMSRQNLQHKIKKYNI
jgi:arginine utilization regulatory protein